MGSWSFWHDMWRAYTEQLRVRSVKRYWRDKHTWHWWVLLFYTTLHNRHCGLHVLRQLLVVVCVMSCHVVKRMVWLRCIIKDRMTQVMHSNALVRSPQGKCVSHDKIMVRMKIKRKIKKWWGRGENYVRCTLLGMGSKALAFWFASRSPLQIGGVSTIFTLTLSLTKIWSIQPAIL